MNDGGSFSMNDGNRLLLLPLIIVDAPLVLILFLHEMALLSLFLHKLEYVLDNGVFDTVSWIFFCMITASWYPKLCGCCFVVVARFAAP